MISEVDGLIASSRSLLGAYSSLSGNRLELRDGVTDNSPEAPLRASSLLLKDDLKRLKQMRWRLFESEEADQEEALLLLTNNRQQVNEMDVAEVEQFYNEVNLLSIRVQRWKNSVCQQDQYAKRGDFDVRPFLRLRNQNQVPAQQYKDALKLCESFHSTSRCLSEWHIYKRNRQEAQFIALYEGRFEADRFQALFELRSTAPKFSCTLDGENKVLEVKISHNDFLKNYFPAREEIELQNVARYWSGEGFRLKFVLVPADQADLETLVLKPAERGLSHVNSESPFLIYLQAHYPQEQRVKLLAHEVGHTLGFPDCYIEFYNRQSGELTYYELERAEGNLMCSLEFGRQIPKAYFDQLIKQSCSQE